MNIQQLPRPRIRALMGGLAAVGLLLGSTTVLPDSGPVASAAESTTSAGQETASDEASAVKKETSGGGPTTTKSLLDLYGGGDNSEKSDTSSEPTKSDTSSEPTTSSTQANGSKKKSPAVKDDPKQPKMVPGHKKGDPTDTDLVQLKDDLKVKIDGKVQTHPCAGRKLAYHGHPDPVYGTFEAKEGEEQKLIVAGIDGQQVTYQQDVCWRLAPDANPDGNDLSHIASTDRTPFLGKPGTKWWLAPQQVKFKDSWRPIWAGFGAFENAHELSLPKNFKDNKVTFNLVGKEGPGEVEMWSDNAGGDPRRKLSTKDKEFQKIPYEFGHGHFNWAFSKPGIYKLKFNVEADTTDGKHLKSEDQDVIWLVGTDKNVGLPRGTTTGLRKVKNPSAQSGAPKPVAPAGSYSSADDPAKDDPKGEQNKEQDVCTDEPKNRAEEIQQQLKKALGDKAPKAIIEKGHVDQAIKHTDKGFETFVEDMQDPTSPRVSQSGQFAFVLDSKESVQATGATLRQVSPGFGNKVYTAPFTQDEDRESPWVGFSGQHLDPKSIKDGSTLEVKIKNFEGPGKFATSHPGLGKQEILLDSDKRELALKYNTKAHDHMAWFFSKPGVYSIEFEFSGTDKDGKPFAEPLQTYWVIGKDNPCAQKNAESDGKDENTGSKGGFTVLNQYCYAIESPNACNFSGREGGGEGGSGDGGTSGGTSPNGSPAGGSDTPAGGASSGTANTGGGTSGGSGSNGSGGASGGTSGGASGGDVVPGNSNAGGTFTDSGTSVGGEVAGAEGEATDGSEGGESAEGPAAEGEEAPAEGELDQASGEQGGITSLPNAGVNGNGRQSRLQALKHALTSGGWLAGFSLGIALMALVGGIALFYAASQNLRRAKAALAAPQTPVSSPTPQMQATAHPISTDTDTWPPYQGPSE